MNRRLADAIVAIFREDASQHHETALPSFTLRDWERTYYWLDASGLALYLLDRINGMRLEKTIPAGVLARLNQNQQDNQARVDDMFLEFVKVNTEFQRAKVRYLNLKGLTLRPRYCSDPALRFQLDLDFLVNEEHAEYCSEILRGRGYLPIVKTGSTWEFKANGHLIPLMRDMYKPKPQRSVELHIVSDSRSPINAAVNWFSRIESQTWRGFTFPVLSESDKFLVQADHLFKHLRSEWTRPSWVWEYRTCVLAGRKDEAFWGGVRDRAMLTGYGVNAIRAASRLASNMFGACAVPALDSWTVELSPQPIDLWIDRYWKDILLAKFPGSKLYLLLPADNSDTHLLNRRRLKKLIPIRRPAADYLLL